MDAATQLDNLEHVEGEDCVQRKGTCSDNPHVSGGRLLFHSDSMWVACTLAPKAPWNVWLTSPWPHLIPWRQRRATLQCPEEKNVNLGGHP